MRVAFCVSGKGSLVRAAVRSAGDIGIEPVTLITEGTASPDVGSFARRRGVPHRHLDTTSAAAMATGLGEALVAAAPELVVLTFDRIVPPSVLDAYPGRILNVHPALLPAFPGMRALERTVESGARVGGATIHEVVEAVDAGPIVAQAVLATDPSESVEAFGGRMYALLEPMFLQVLHWYAQGRVGHDDSGRVIVRGATYGTLPISPALE